MRLVHYSNAPVQEVQQRVQPEEDIFKPRGLWVSDDDCKHNWYQHCIQDQFRLDRLTHVHDVTLVPNANVLILHSASDIDEFTQKYRDPESSPASTFRIDWWRVPADGIIITPYIKARANRRCMKAAWYHPWDCASGCIWNPASIASIRLREIVPVPLGSDDLLNSSDTGWVIKHRA